MGTMHAMAYFWVDAVHCLSFLRLDNRLLYMKCIHKTILTKKWTRDRRETQNENKFISLFCTKKNFKVRERIWWKITWIDHISYIVDYHDEIPIEILRFWESMYILFIHDQVQDPNDYGTPRKLCYILLHFQYSYFSKYQLDSLCTSEIKIMREYAVIFAQIIGILGEKILQYTFSCLVNTVFRRYSSTNYNSNIHQLNYIYFFTGKKLDTHSLESKLSEPKVSPCSGLRLRFALLSQISNSYVCTNEYLLQ